ncbi:MAG: aldolase catalytic domain-containing protein [Lachnospiraceae bacterium]|nr:aldolase catalytic domain-containing protein [Lachnospiraceae bacterium]
MTKEIQLLDCTVRDGGYINDWEFGHNKLISIFERLVDTGVDIIEIGFIDDRRPFDINRSIGPDTASLKKVWGAVNKRPGMVVGMIDYGTCRIENIEPADKSFIDGIRVIFKKQKMHEAMAYCAQLKELGYKVFSQLVSITAYEDDDLMELISLANEVKPYAVSMVDTYGLLLPEKLLHYTAMLDQHLDKGIRLGFHAHNNFQMGFANAMAFLGRDTERSILVDGTLFGMGKSAGNAPLELLAMQLNDRYGKNYNIAPMLEAIEESIRPIYRETPWGYQKFFYMVAKEECHPNYLTFFKKQGNLSQTDLDKILGRIHPEEKKLLYDEELAQQLYDAYIEENYNDAVTYQKMQEAFEGKSIMLVGPGKNIMLQKEAVEQYLEQNAPIKIAINHIPKDMKVDYLFLTKGSRYEEMTDALHNENVRIIATSNITAKNDEFDYVVTRKPLLEIRELFEDNSFLMLLRVLKRAGVKKLACAGMDGYSGYEDNYADPSMEYDFVKKSAIYLNRHVQHALESEFNDMEVSFITYSHYTDVLDMDSAAY